MIDNNLCDLMSKVSKYVDLGGKEIFWGKDFDFGGSEGYRTLCIKELY